MATGVYQIPASTEPANSAYYSIYVDLNGNYCVKKPDGTVHIIGAADNEFNGGADETLRYKGKRTYSVASLDGSVYRKVNVTAGIMVQVFSNADKSLLVYDAGRVISTPEGTVDLPAKPGTVGKSRLDLVVWDTVYGGYDVVSGAVYNTGDDFVLPAIPITQLAVNAFIQNQTDADNGDIGEEAFFGPLETAFDSLSTNNADEDRAGASVTSTATGAATFTALAVSPTNGGISALSVGGADGVTVSVFTFDANDSLNSLVLINRVTVSSEGLTIQKPTENVRLDGVSARFASTAAVIDLLKFGQSLSVDITGDTTYNANSHFQSIVPKEIIFNGGANESLNTLTGAVSEMIGWELDLRAAPGMELTIENTPIGSVTAGCFILEGAGDITLDGDALEFLRVRCVPVFGGYYWQQVAPKINF